KKKKKKKNEKKKKRVVGGVALLPPGQPAAGGVRQPDGPAVGGDEPVDDGEAEPGAVLTACGVPQESAGPLLRCHAWAVVGDGQHGADPRFCDRDPDRPALVADGLDRVVDQVVEDLLQVPGAKCDKGSGGGGRRVRKQLDPVAVGHR